MNTRLGACAAAVALVLTSCALGSVDERSPGLAERPQPTPTVDLRQSDVPPPRSSVAEIVERTLPSVVNVRVKSLDVGLFGDPVERQGEGSGVVVDRDGIILTNNHVIQGAVEVTVVFKNGEHEPMEGEVVGTVAERDLAVIRVDEDDLEPIEIGRSESLRLGDEVVALGFPLGLGPTVTKGIISAKERTIRPQAGPRLHGLLQTDAAINPGNSGGALVDMNGRLVGINTAAAHAGVAENVGFAIAIDDALPVIEEILTEPPQERAWLGVYLDTLVPEIATQLGLDPDLEGAVVLDVVPGSPAQAAGLRKGDVIAGVGGTDIGSANDLIDALTQLDPGETVELEVVDESGSRSVEVELVQRPATFED